MPTSEWFDASCRCETGCCRGPVILRFASNECLTWTRRYLYLLHSVDERPCWDACRCAAALSGARSLCRPMSVPGGRERTFRPYRGAGRCRERRFRQLGLYAGLCSRAGHAPLVAHYHHGLGTLLWSRRKARGSLRAPHDRRDDVSRNGHALLAGSGRQARQPCQAALCPSVLEHDGLLLDIAKVVQPSPECVDVDIRR